MNINISDVLVKVTKKKSGGCKKLGRNKKKCEKYRTVGKREKNKARRIAKEEKRQRRLQQYKADILAGRRPETNTHKKAA